jgi:hypothetical protein
MLGDVWGDSLTRIELDVTGHSDAQIAVEQDQESADE